MACVKIITQDPELKELCIRVREFVFQKQYTSCETLICKAMAIYPHAPQPHNLYGILLEKEGCHAAAMNHFRAALALDPTYKPAAKNLKNYGTFYSDGRCAFDESDVPENAYYTMIYDENQVGYIVRRDNT